MCNHECAYDDFHYYIEFIDREKQDLEKKIGTADQYEKPLIQAKIDLLKHIVHNGRRRLFAKKDLRLKNKREHRKLMRRKMEFYMPH